MRFATVFACAWCLAGCASPSPRPDPRTVEADADAYRGILHLLGSPSTQRDDRRVLASVLSHARNLAALQAMVDYASDKRVYAEAAGAPGAPSGSPEIEITVGMLCRHMICEALAVEANTNYVQRIEDWAAWWRQFEGMSIAEIRVQIRNEIANERAD
jgi:hypothetical protein